ncbi:MAG: hypothetical protein JJU45_08125 [Acidimicrobiia bacterium]|nr:hypothetical protein [Acidimicrobiia bacterium]
MDTAVEVIPITVGNRRITDGWDRLRRYCGLDWSGGPPETWAFQYFDVVDTIADDEITEVDLLAAGALHPGLGRSDLAFFREQGPRLGAWLRDIPRDTWLRDADDQLLAELALLAPWDGQVQLSLLTKVLHRKRPRLIPLLDRSIIDWYRPLTGQRRAAGVWGPLLGAMRENLNGENAVLLAIIGVSLEKELPRPLSHVRMLDIMVWMEGQP